MNSWSVRSARSLTIVLRSCGNEGDRRRTPGDRSSQQVESGVARREIAKAEEGVPAAGTSRVEMQGGRRKQEMSDNHDPRAERPPVTTTGAGIPAASDQHSLTVGPSGDQRIFAQIFAIARTRIGGDRHNRERTRRLDTPKGGAG